MTVSSMPLHRALDKCARTYANAESLGAAITNQAREFAARRLVREAARRAKATAEQRDAAERHAIAELARNVSVSTAVDNAKRAFLPKIRRTRGGDA